MDCTLSLLWQTQCASSSTLTSPSAAVTWEVDTWHFLSPGLSLAREETSGENMPGGNVSHPRPESPAIGCRASAVDG